MPKKRNARKGKDPVVEEKKRQLKELLEDFRVSASEYEVYLNTLCTERCNQISKLYMDKLKSIPENIRNMTITQFMEQQENIKRSQTECPKDEVAVRSQFERSKMTSEKKRTLKKEKKRSLSASAAARPLAIPRPPTNTFSRLSRTVSDSSLATPARLNRMSNMVVTPKFNPKLPVSKMARVPKPGELLMSMSGSPLQNFADAETAKITVSLGQGRVLTFTEEADLDKDLIEKIDEPMKKTIKNLKEKLDKILQE